MRTLLFTLYAPMCACGEIAVGERRMSWARPGRSAILGLVAAAQGIDREDEEAHQRLESTLHYAVRTDAPGTPLVDYHTAQTPKARKGRFFATRREELEADELNTVLSVREWRVDAFFTIALWSRAGQEAHIDGIADCLKHPHYVLYLGRKSAPLGLPLRPEIVQTDTFLNAFDIRKPNQREAAVLEQIAVDQASTKEIAFDADAPIELQGTQIQRRRDAVANRSRWQYMDRLERVLRLGNNGD